MRRSIVCLLLAACVTPEEEGITTVTADAGAPAADASSADLPPLQFTFPLPDAGVAACKVGEPQMCACPGGAVGWKVCLSPDGRTSECGCLSAKGPDVLVPPPPPRIESCGQQRCAPYTQEDTAVSARHCCTPDGRCGSSSAFIFGAACVPRGAPKGMPHTACSDEAPNFLDLYGCCRADGQCGLSIDHVANFDLGCVERSEMARLLNAGSGQRDLLSLFFLLPIKKAEFAPARCAR